MDNGTLTVTEGGSVQYGVRPDAIRVSHDRYIYGHKGTFIRQGGSDLVRDIRVTPTLIGTAATLECVSTAWCRSSDKRLTFNASYDPAANPNRNPHLRGPSDWQVHKYLRIRPVEDNNRNGATLTLTHRIEYQVEYWDWSMNGGGGGLRTETRSHSIGGSITVTVIDDEALPGINTQQGNVLAVEGETVTYSMRPNTNVDPGATVHTNLWIKSSPNTYRPADEESLFADAYKGYVAEPKVVSDRQVIDLVTINLVEDGDDVDDVIYISHDVSGYPGYGGGEILNFTITVCDNDKTGMRLDSDPCKPVLDAQMSEPQTESQDQLEVKIDGLPKQDEQSSDTSALESAIQARIDLTAQRGDNWSNRIWRGALAAVRGEQPSGDARTVDQAFAQRLANNHFAKGRAELSQLWQDIADALN